MVAILHFSCWSLLDDKDITTTSTTGTSHTNSTSSIITQAITYCKILQECIFALAIGRLIYWESLDDSTSYTYLTKYFYSPIVLFTAFGVTALCSRSTGQIIVSIGSICVLLLRMAVASLFSTGVKGSIIAGLRGLGISIIAIGAVLIGGLQLNTRI